MLDGTRAADIVFDDVRVRADALVGAPGRRAAADRGRRRFRDGARLRRGRRRDQLRQRRDARLPEDAQAVRRADRLVPGVAAPDGRPGDRVRAGEVDGEPRVRRRRYRARSVAARSRIVSAAKVRIADACRRVSQESVQLHGGMGMSDELKVSHTFRRLTAIAQQFGDADHHLERFAALSDRTRRTRMTERNRQVLLASRPQGAVTEQNFRIVDAPLPRARRRRGAGEERVAVARSVHARPDERREVVRAAGAARRRDGGPDRRRGGRVARCARSTSATRC